LGSLLLCSPAVSVYGLRGAPVKARSRLSDTNHVVGAAGAKPSMSVCGGGRQFARSG